MQLIDVRALRDMTTSEIEHCEDFLEIIEKQPVIDAVPTAIIPTVTVTDTPMVEYVPVVRCKDCKHVQHDVIFDQRWCKGREVTPDWFCADGKRKP